MLEIDVLKRRYEREREARKAAEAILEQKALELFNANQDLRAFNESLEHLVTERTQALEMSQIRMAALISNLHAGVLLEDENHKVILMNQQFCDLFKVPFPPNLLIGTDTNRGTRYAKSQFMNPEKFIERKDEILSKREVVIDEECLMADGSVYERDFIPIYVKNDYLGHLWKYRDISDSRRAHDKMRASEEKYRGIIENMELGLMEVDNNGRIVLPYPRFCEMVGYTQEELIGKDAIETFLPKEYLPVFQQQSEDRMRGKAGVYEIQLIRKDGERIWVIISGAPIFDLAGNITGSLGIHYDITYQKKLQFDLELARHRAEASQEAEKQFLANMSHEIRTPLNAIIGMSHLLHDTNPTEEQKDFLQILKNSAEILRMLISDVLDLSKIRSGKVELQEKEFDLSGLVRALVKSTQLRLEERPLMVTANIDAALKSYVLGDDLLLNQILTNLIGNAEKFTAEGKIEVDVKVLSHEGGQYMLEFQVSDTGIGIPDNKIDLIFQSFRQVDGDIKRKFGGTGLGLSITKQLIELQGGNIEVRSTLGKGSTFVFNIPYKDTNKELLCKDEAKVVSNRPTTDGKRVLVVEDNFMNRKYISTLLERWNMDYKMANNGREGFEMAQKHKFDIIFMDIQMPVMDGYEATIAIRNSNNLNRDTQIIALTASAMLSQKDKAFQAGVNDYLSKPFKPEQLIEKINSVFLENETSQEEITAQDDENSSNTEGVTFFKFDKRLDAQLLYELYQEEWDYVREMFKTFLEYTVPEFDQLREAHDQKNIEEVRRLAHKMKPTLGMVGLSNLQQLMLELEITAKNGVDIDLINELYQKIMSDFPSALEAVQNDFKRLRLIET